MIMIMEVVMMIMFISIGVVCFDSGVIPMSSRSSEDASQGAEQREAATHTS